MQSHSYYLQQALELAKRRRGFCAPNPSVGAVIVKDGTVIAQGVHFAAGSPHAEIEALNQLSENSNGAILYVTLEPCCHYGKTPPCTKQIIERGIKQVFFAFSDPNQQVRGLGERELQSAGVLCQRIEVPEIIEFYHSYDYWIRTRLAWVTAKIAISLDGKIAAQDGSPIAITGTGLQQFTHSWRRRSDAILTTVKTIIKDDPLLNVREAGEIIAKDLYVLDRQLSLPLSARVISSAKSLTLFYDENLSQERVHTYQEQGLRCIAVANDEDKLNLRAVLKTVGQDGVHDLWIEAGGKLFSRLLQDRLMQRSLIYVAPKLLGENAIPAFSMQAFNFLEQAQSVQWQIIDKDVVCEVTW